MRKVTGIESLAVGGLGAAARAGASHPAPIACADAPAKRPVLFQRQWRGSMLRLKGKNLDLPVEWHHANSLDPSPGAKNRVRISVKGGTATFYVNDAQIATFKGPLPNGAGKLGVIVKSEPGKRDAWKFINLKATDL